MTEKYCCKLATRRRIVPTRENCFNVAKMKSIPANSYNLLPKFCNFFDHFQYDFTGKLVIDKNVASQFFTMQNSIKDE